jgi:L-ascorbate 6-phosphate lactonase
MRSSETNIGIGIIMKIPILNYVGRRICLLIRGRASSALAVTLIFSASLGLMAQRPLPSVPIAPQLTEVPEKLALWWTGNAGWLMRSPKVMLGIDLILEPEPFLDEFSMDVRYERPLRAADLGKLNYALVTHEHGDHFGRNTCRILLEKSNCRFVLPRSCLKAADEVGIPVGRRIIAVPGEVIKLDGATLYPLHAFHGDLYGAVYRGASFDDCGYVIEIGGKRVLHPGDSILTQEQRELKDIAVLLVSITEHNMWNENSARLANALRPRIILPMHYDSYTKAVFWTVGDPEKVRSFLDKDIRDRFRPVRQGERVYID